MINKMGHSKVQSILFARDKWTEEGAKRWLREHGYKYGKVHRTESYLRYRQFEPGEDASNHQYRTINFDEKRSIKAVIEY